MSQLFAKLPELCFVNFLDNNIEIISAKKYSKYACDVGYLDKEIKSIIIIVLFLNFEAEFNVLSVNCLKYRA